MHLFAPDPSLLSPRGFLPRVPDPHRVLTVPAGAVWGTGGLEALREAALVRVGEPEPPRPADDTPGTEEDTPEVVLGRALAPADLALQTVLSLSLAGVLVEGAHLLEPVRRRLDPGLMDLLDRATPSTAQDAAAREELSLLLRRRAWAVAGYPRGEAAVLVLLPEDCPPQLRQDLDRQTWPTRVEVPAGTGRDAHEAFARAREDGAVYCCRLVPGLRYGPHHLADLVHGLRHSGAAAARSPVRYWPWGEGQWLEDDTAALEQEAVHTLAGGSLWYAADGPEEPGSGGYAVSGVNAVPDPDAGGDAGHAPPAAPWRLLTDVPPLLGWLGADPPRPAGLPPGYLASSSSPTVLDRS